MTELYKKLLEHREMLRDREGKHTPTAVISDDALKALSKSKPTSLEDMLKVNGIGKSFVANYGQGFLAVILQDMKPVKLTMMRKEAVDTLKNLQARLTNVNRRNRMLYLSKPQQGKAIDLAAAGDGEKIINTLLTFNGTPLTLCKADDACYADYKRLIRSAGAGARESGNNMLYVGYPFVTGRCGADQSFNVSAPLVLFPVKLDDAGGKITLCTDGTRDITYNNALILCFNKFNGKATEQLPNCAVEDVQKRGYMTDVVAFYEKSGIYIKVKDSAELEKYGAYTDKTFPKYAPNEYELKNSAVVGLFPMYSGAMQKDFDDIIAAGVMPPSLTELLTGADEIDDFYGNSIDTIESLPLDSEASIDYINELNVSQERAIERAATGHALVMQGPPGTGKSQTITSMISDAVGKNRSVLVVSQKRAALSVIYSRLGKISRYAMFIDDPKDKDAFYAKLRAMFDSVEKPAPFNSVAYQKAANAVDADVAALDEVADMLESDEYGAPMLDIYRENMTNPFKEAERNMPNATGEAAVFRDCVADELLGCGYEELKAASGYLDDQPLIDKLCEYYSISEQYPWIIDVKPRLSDADTARLLTELDGVLDLFAQGKKFKMKRAVKSFVKANFTVYDGALKKSFCKDPVSLYNGIKAYSAFYMTKLTADSLDFCTRLYFGTLYCLSKETGKSCAELNKRLFDYCGYAFIDMFENEHDDIMSRIDNFTSIVAHICQSIDKKLTLTKDKTLNALKAAFNSNIAESKRRGDMLRAIDGKRRMAPARFAEKFGFELFRGVRVFLMTPEAVSEILPLDNTLFDLLVFDEASQIYVERGIPAIARAKRIVVCGDHKQLRPSSLGDGRITVDEDEENEAILEEESLLDIARFKFPEVMLSYHYRSRYEELIAFSNAAFYGGKLNISPNPAPPAYRPITVHKENGRWEDRVNVAEAQKVLELITEYFEETADIPQNSRDTLGVITFNALQRDCILDMIDKKCDADPEFGARYREELMRREDGEDLGLFVKNIENVQGDERDRIIFSFAYAYNSKGVMSRNFGWLNRPGGENRLNVAISRAKRRIDIVTSIVPSDLRVDDIKSEGVRILRKYLDYAYCVSDGDEQAAKQVLDSFGNDEAVTRDEENGLTDMVYAALEARGIDVVRDVGMGNYKLDMAVKNAKGDYVLGIECDDSAIHGCDATRERDVMRRRFFESRGWRFMRVWSPEWYKNPDSVIKRIESVI